MPEIIALKLKDYLFPKGCFTEEYCILKMTLKQIGRELGLLSRVIRNGAYILFK